MGNIFGRLANITRVNVEHYSRSLSNFIKDKRKGPGPERKSEEERFSGFKKDAGNSTFHSSGAGSDSGHSSRDGYKKNTHSSKYSDIPQQVIEDLAVFNLIPPSSFKEVRKARNREIKKYHSDKFMNDSEKLETSKQIMQIYNTAYDRLKNYYN